jgi:CheY-like chemotaxis protein
MQTSGQTDGERIHVAIVEDDDMLREALALGLDEGRYRVTSHGNARAALRAFDEEEVPDVIVLDLMLPEMDGWAFRKAQKQSGRLQHVPVVVVSSMPESARPIDAQARLRKPVDTQELEDAVQRVLTTRRVV